MSSALCEELDSFRLESEKNLIESLKLPPNKLISNYLKRISTFENGHQYMPVSPEHWAEAGFINNHSGYIICNYCDLSENLTSRRSPWELHTIKRPDCPFVQNYKFLEYRLSPDEVVKLWIKEPIIKTWSNFNFLCTRRYILFITWALL